MVHRRRRQNAYSSCHSKRPGKRTQTASSPDWNAPEFACCCVYGRESTEGATAGRATSPRPCPFSSPHPSPLFVNNRPGNRDVILGVLREVAKHLDGSGRAPAMPAASAMTCPAVPDKFPQPQTVAGCVSAVLQSLSARTQQHQGTGETLSPCFAQEIELY